MKLKDSVLLAGVTTIIKQFNLCTLQDGTSILNTL